MLGYVSIETLAEKSSLKKYALKVKKVGSNCKGVDIHLHKNFDMSKEKHVKKIQKIFKKEKIDNIIFQKEVIDKYRAIVDSAYTNDINIITGNMLYTNMVSNIMNYVFDLCENVKIEEVHLGIAMDLISYNKLEYIKQMCNRVRAITILSNIPSKFDNLCKEMLKEYGIVIKCTDNFKSGLKDCNVCVNFDMENSSIMSCIQNRCIFVNMNLPIRKMKKSFKGIVINDIVVDISDINTQDIDTSSFRSLAIAQAYNMEKNDRKILSCVGINGNINEEEFRKFRIFKVKK